MNRVKLRENTFKLLYCNDFHNRSEMPKQYDLFWEETPEVSEEDRKFISNRVDAIAEKIDEIDEAINKAAVKWTTDRMSKVDLTILRLAYYEMKTFLKKLLLIRPLNLLRNMEQMIHLHLLTVYLQSYFRS